LKAEKFRDPHGPASEQFDGTGSYGNGGGMRIAPAALFGYNLEEANFDVIIDNVLINSFLIL